MKIDIQKPKHLSKNTLYTLARSLTAEQIAERNPAWYAPDALRYDDCLLKDDWDSDLRIAILDPDYEYETLELDEAITKYQAILSNANNPIPDRITAHCILDLCVGNHWIEDREVRDKLKTLLLNTASELWPK